MRRKLAQGPLYLPASLHGGPKFHVASYHKGKTALDPVRPNLLFLCQSQALLLIGKHYSNICVSSLLYNFVLFTE